MSWKGIKKAVQRLPHQVLRTTGQAEGTYDEEFEQLNVQFEQLDDATLKLHDNAVKLKRSIECLLVHQSTFASTLCDIYSPITGRSNSPDSNNSSPSLISSSPKIPSTLQRNNTPPESMEAAQTYLRNIENLGSSFSQELSSIERRIIMPSVDLMDIFKSIKKSITKRNHKQIDYDRYKLDVQKHNNNKDASKDERKLINLEQQLQQATHEYTTLNNHIKHQLPTVLNLRIQFIDPCFQSLYLTQYKLYSMLVNAFTPLVHSSFISLMEPVIPTFKRRHAIAESLVAQLTILKSNGQIAIDPKPASTPIMTPASSVLVSNDSDKPSHTVSPPKYDIVPTMVPISMPLPVVPLTATAPLAALPKSVKVVVALYAFTSQQHGDLTFEEGDRIDVLEATGSTNDWWKGRIGDRVGYFPANYTQIV